MNTLLFCITKTYYVYLFLVNFNKSLLIQCLSTCIDTKFRQKINYTVSLVSLFVERVCKIVLLLAIFQLI